ncbi:hypothetical protein FGG08_007703, partial [Glutinoglossum americanum]
MYQAAKGKYAGVGFVLASDDLFFGVDLDDGTPQESIEHWVGLLDTYTEFSPSGKGLRLFGVGALPAGARKRGTVECYETGRFLTVTGHRLEGSAEDVQPRQSQIEQFHSEAFPAKARVVPSVARMGGLEGFSGNDTELLSVAFSARNGAKLADLYSGSWQGKYKSLSEAVPALLWGLAFYTKDAARLDGLFRGSGLFAQCAKWDDSRGASTWGALEIEKAIASVKTSYHRGVPQTYEPPTFVGTRSFTNVKPTEQRSTVRLVQAVKRPKSEQAEIVIFPCTDLGNAERLVARHGANLRYTAAWGWLVWDGRRWEVDGNGEVYRLAKET